MKSLAIAGLTLAGCATVAPPAREKEAFPYAAHDGAARHDAVPYLGERGQQRYEEYLALPSPRAFAISESGHYGFASGTKPRDPTLPSDPTTRALATCREAAGEACDLYAVNDAVVFNGQRRGAPVAPRGAMPATAETSAAVPAATPVAAPPRADIVAVPPAAAAPPPAAAQGASRIRFAGNVVLDHQLNALATVQYADGSTKSIGDALFGVSAGAAVALTDDGRFEVQGVGGFLVSRASASNGSLTFWTFPVELTGHVRLGRFRLGAGPSVHLSPMLRGDGFFANARADFDTAFGAVGQVEFLATQHLGVALRGTWTKISANGQSLDASRLGGGMSFYF